MLICKLPQSSVISKTIKNADNSQHDHLFYFSGFSSRKQAAEALIGQDMIIPDWGR